MSMSLQPYLGANVNPLSVEEMQQRGLLQEGETLLALFDGILLDENGQRVGGMALSDFVALTNQRLITWARGFFNDTVDGLPWQDVDVGEAMAWDPFHGRVRIVVRLPPVEPRKRRISVKGTAPTYGGEPERVFVNTLDFMPAEDVPVLAKMIGWVGELIDAGVTPEELVQHFAEEFPAPEQSPGITRNFAALSEPENPPAPASDQKKPWWQRIKGQASTNPNLGETAVGTPEDLITAYERNRGGDIIGPARSMSLTRSNSQVMPEQPAMYDISRGLRLMLEVPRRLQHSLRRASEVMSGTNELIGNVQDSQTRRRAYAGLRHAMNQQEEQRGPFAPVAPVVRAVLTLTEPDETAPENEPEAPSARRISVRSAIRERTASAADNATPTEAAAEAQPAVHSSASVRRPIGVRREPAPEAAAPAEMEGHPEAAPQIRSNASVRRPIAVRREPAEQPTAAEAAPAPEVAPAAERSCVPVRRIVVNHEQDRSAIGQQPVVAESLNGKTPH
jgi:hypothetical protein